MKDTVVSVFFSLKSFTLGKTSGHFTRTLKQLYGEVYARRSRDYLPTVSADFPVVE